MSTFITNSENKKLGERIKELCLASSRFDMLVGYFYFSTLGTIAEAMEADSGRKMRVLVGLEAESGSHDLLWLGSENKDGGSNENIRERFYESVERCLKNPALDREKFFKRLELIIGWIASGRLEIRKTFKPNHSKLYLFEMDAAHKDVLDRVFITGSSNFTEPGVSLQDEFNVEIKDYGTDEAQAYYDALWEEAVPLTEDDEQKQFLIAMLRDLSSLVTPYEAYMRVLKAYIDYQESNLNTSRVERLLEKAGFNKYSYQVDAVAQAMRKLEDYGGVIVADVVGLGKTIIGCLIGALSDKRGMVICPPGLLGPENGEGGGWNGYLKSFGLDEIGWKAMSKGDLENIAQTMKNGNYGIVIVDEAHAFRNRKSASYEQLHSLCAGREVVLLSATPFNNRPDDLLSLILLFSEAKDSPFVKSGDIEEEFNNIGLMFKNIRILKSLIKKEADILKLEAAARNCGVGRIAAYGGTQREKFEEIVKELIKAFTSRLRAVIEQIVIRRNRIDIEKTPLYRGEIGEMSKVQDPEAQLFELTKEQNDFYDRVINEYFSDEKGTSHFHGTIYRPDCYVISGNRDDYQENVYKMIRQGLVLRFESSFGSFRQSICNVLRTIEHTKDFIKKTDGRIYYSRKIMEKVLNLADDEDFDVVLDRLIAEDQEKLRNSGKKNGKLKTEYNLYSDNFDGKRYMQELDEDIELLKRILAEIDSLNLAENDPKAEALVKSVKAVIAGTHEKIQSVSDEPKRKVIVFTGYADTMKHLTPMVERAFPGRVLAVSGENFNKTVSTIVRDNFDASIDNGKDNYDVLIATDKLSEGLNLNRAGLAINYDIPWNPTRVIQRVGRINRIGKMVFKNLYIFNFFPTLKGASVTQNQEIVQEKMFAIHGILGEDSKMFSLDEEPTPAELYKKLCSLDDGEELGFYTKVKGTYESGLASLRRHHPEIADRLGKDIQRVKSAFKGEPRETFMFVRRGPSLFACKHDSFSGAISDCSLQEAIEGIECKVSTEKSDFSPDFWDYKDLKTGKAILGIYSKLQENFKSTSHVSGLTTANHAASRLKNNLSSFNSSEQEFVKVLIFDLNNVGTLPHKTIVRLANPKLSFEELRETVLDIKATLGEDLFKENRKKKNVLEVIATVQKV